VSHPAAAIALACCALACATPVLDGALEDAGLANEDGGAVEEDGGAPIEEEDGGAMLDGGAAVDFDGGAPRDGGTLRDGGAAMDGGARDAGTDAGTTDAGTPDAGAGCDTLVGTTRCGATKLFEVSEATGPSAFDFAAGRTMFLASEVSAAQGDVYLFSAELATTSPGTVTEITFVSPRDSAASGGTRGVFRKTGIANLTLLDGGPRDPATFAAIPAGITLREATRGTTNRVLAREGHIYGLHLNQDPDGGTSSFAAIVVDRLVTPAGDGGAQRQSVELRWLWQSTPGQRTFDRPFGPR
jgi:hypothetical protein